MLDVRAVDEETLPIASEIIAGAAKDESGFIHKLSVRRAHAGAGLSRAMID